MSDTSGPLERWVTDASLMMALNGVLLSPKLVIDGILPMKLL